MNNDITDNERKILYQALSFVMDYPNAVTDLYEILEVQITELDIKLLLLKLK